MSNVDATRKIKFTMPVANESVLEFLDLSLHIDEHSKICGDVLATPTNGFAYLLPSISYHKKNINNVSKSIPLRLGSICDADEKFDTRSSEYQNYLIARDYKPTFVKRQFHDIKNISRREPRQVKSNLMKSNFKLITLYNPVIKNSEKVSNENAHISYDNLDMKKVFPERTISATYRRGKCLKELISLSLYPRTVTESASRVSKCNESKCDKCTNYIVVKNEFTCTDTGKTYKVRGDLTCKSNNVVYLINCKKCKQQYVGSAFENSFKPRFRVHKSDTNAGKVRCGVAKHFLNNC